MIDIQGVCHSERGEESSLLALKVLASALLVRLLSLSRWLSMTDNTVWKAN